MFFALPNLSSSTVRLVEKPWEEKPAPDDKWSLPKDQFRLWHASPSTEHTYLSLVEGLDPLRRVAGKDDNNPTLIHGLIADYDADIPVDRMCEEYMKKRKSGDFLPNWISRSHGPGVHAVWLFENPVKVNSASMAECFMEHAFKRLKASSLYPGLGKESWDPFQYFELGRDWKPVAGKPIPENHVWHWLYEAGSNVKFSVDMKETAIPMDQIAARIEELFPGQWDGGTMEPGARGKAFWVKDSTTLRCAVVREGGMQCFLSSQPPFVPWSKILGREWCEAFHADRVGEVMKRFWYDESSREFIELDPTEKFPDVRFHTKDQLDRIYRARYGITRQKMTNRDMTEVDYVLTRTEDEKRVHEHGYVIYKPAGLIEAQGRRILNVSTVRPLPPAPPDGTQEKWGDRFPFIAQLIASLMKTPAHMKPTGRNQLEFFLAYIKYAYTNALLQRPQPGQVCFLAGPANAGKTLLVDRILAPLLAGPGATAEPAEESAFGRTEFNQSLGRSPVWKIDDKLPKTAAEHSHYSNFIKVTAADATLRVRQMRVNPGKTQWNGRLFVLMNMDAKSSSLLPSTEASMLGKLNLFLCHRNPDLKFPSRTTGDKWIREQLPYFGKFLMEWKIPVHCISEETNVRYGVRTYHDTTIRRMAFEQGSVFGFYEYLQIFMAQVALQTDPATGQNKTEWVGTAANLSVEMGEMLGRSRDLSSTSIGRNLAILESRGAGPRQKHNGKARLWHIPVSMNNPEDADDGDEMAGGSSAAAQEASVEAMETELSEALRDGTLPVIDFAAAEKEWERKALEAKV